MKLYIDPGTGSMLFTILIGVIGAGLYAVRMLLIKIRFWLSGGKVKEESRETPIVIFSDNRRYWPVFEPVCRELDRRGRDVVYMTASPDDPGLENPYPHVKAEFIGEGNQAFAKLNFINATLVLSTTPGLDVYQWKRSKTAKYYVHLLHAPSDVTMYRMFGIDYYDAILLSGDYQGEDIRALETLRGLPAKELVKVGIPYMDVMAERLAREGPAPAHEPTVLLAPSWGPGAIFSVYGERVIEELLKTGYHLIIRPHPQSFISENELIERLMRRFPASEQLEWNRDNDNFQTLRRSDILVSDFSGVIFEFALIFDRPVIYTDPKMDLGPYDAWWLDAVPWTLRTLPKLGRELTEELLGDLKQGIDACLTDPGYAQGRREAREETWAWPGEGAVRVVDYLLDRYEKLGEEKEA